MSIPAENRRFRIPLWKWALISMSAATVLGVLYAIPMNFLIFALCFLLVEAGVSQPLIENTAQTVFETCGAVFGFFGIPHEITIFIPGFLGTWLIVFCVVSWLGFTRMNYVPPRG